MTRAEAVNWLINIRADIGQARHSELWNYEQALADIIDLLETQSEQETGKWIPQPGGGYCCSKCGRYALHDVDGKFALLFTKSKYCPHCGAKMEDAS